MGTKGAIIMAKKFYEDERIVTTAHGKNAPSATKVKIGAKSDDDGTRLFVDIRKFVHGKNPDGTKKTRGYGQHTAKGLAIDVTTEEGLKELHEIIKGLQKVERDLKGQVKDSTVAKVS
jgi:hypothetical protein